MLQLAAMPVCLGLEGWTFEVVVAMEVVEVILMVLLLVLETASAEIPTQ